jgi:hypothetical protein
VAVNGLIDGFITFDTADIAGPDNGALTRYVAPGFKPHKTPCQVVGFAVWHFHATGDTQLHRYSGFIPGNRRVGICPLDKHAFAKLPDGMYGNDFAFFPLS